MVISEAGETIFVVTIIIEVIIEGIIITEAIIVDLEGFAPNAPSGKIAIRTAKIGSHRIRIITGLRIKGIIKIMRVLTRPHRILIIKTTTKTINRISNRN